MRFFFFSFSGAAAKKILAHEVGVFDLRPKRMGGRYAKAQFISDIPTIKHASGAQ